MLIIIVLVLAAFGGFHIGHRQGYRRGARQALLQPRRDLGLPEHPPA
jgi:hypothetical protein